MQVIFHIEAYDTRFDSPDDKTPEKEFIIDWPTPIIPRVGESMSIVFLVDNERYNQAPYIVSQVQWCYTKVGMPEIVLSIDKEWYALGEQQDVFDFDNPTQQKDS